MELHHCSTCKQKKSAECFYRNRASHSGLDHRCKECSRAQDKARRKIQNEYRRKDYVNNREKYLARRLVREHIRRGLIVRGSCEVCGKENAQAHHPDYSKPLEVRWLCVTHHLKLEAEIRPKNTITCIDCGQERVHEYSQRCKNCAHKNYYKNNRKYWAEYFQNNKEKIYEYRRNKCHPKD